MNSLTPFSEVNATLSHFNTRLTTLLARRLLGMYVVGSLSLGDFDLNTSDIDFIVVIDEPIDDELVKVLRLMHADFDASGSPWSKRIEAIYVTPDAFDLSLPNPKPYPQVEKAVELFMARLEDGWAFQCYSLREYGLIVSGADPRSLIKTIDRKHYPPAVAAIAQMWLNSIANDPTWVDWLREVPHQQFVIFTLCRLLYSLETGDVASKPAAARWAQTHLPPPWVALVTSSLTNPHSELNNALVTDTIAFIHYTFDRSQSDK